jgi:hypothetical protein
MPGQPYLAPYVVEIRRRVAKGHRIVDIRSDLERRLGRRVDKTQLIRIATGRCFKELGGPLKPVKFRRPALSPATLKAMKALYKAGRKNHAEIASFLGVDFNTVKRYCGRRDTRKRISPRQIQLLVRLLREDKLSFAAIARRVGCSNAYVSHFYYGRIRKNSNYGWTPKPLVIRGTITARRGVKSLTRSREK